jgi:hypothetical protein
MRADPACDEASTTCFISLNRRGSIHLKTHLRLRQCCSIMRERRTICSAHHEVEIKECSQPSEQRSGKGAGTVAKVAMHNWHRSHATHRGVDAFYSGETVTNFMARAPRPRGAVTGVAVI